MSPNTPTTAPVPSEKQKFWPLGWWKLMETRIGVIPIPVFVTVLALIGYFLSRGQMPTGASVMIAVIAVGGFLCAEVGKRLPLLRNIGGAAILATFIPSALVYYEVLPDS